IVELEFAGDDFQQRRFAGAVAPDEADALAGFERKIRVIEQRHVTEGELGGREGDDCHVLVLPIGGCARGLKKEIIEHCTGGGHYARTRALVSCAVAAVMPLRCAAILGYNCAWFTIPGCLCSDCSPNRRLALL